MYLAAGGRLIVIAVAKMVLDVCGEVMWGGQVFELAEDFPAFFADDIGEDVQPASMGHG